MVRVFDKRLVFGLALIALVLLVNALVGYQKTRQLSEDARWLSRSRTILQSLDELLLSLVDAETGQRGYLLTGDQRYLEPYYYAAAKLVPEEVERIDELTSDDPGLHNQLSGLEPLIRSKLKELQQTITLHRENPQAARQLVLSGQGKAAMDSIRLRISEIKRNEVALLDLRRQQSNGDYSTAIRAGLIGAALGLGLVGAFGWTLWRDVSAISRTNALLHDQREWFRTTLSSIGDAVIATDPGGRIRFLNGAAESLTGWPGKEAIGLPLGEVFRIIDEVTRDRCEDPVKRILDSTKVVGLPKHTVLITRGGEETSIAVSGANIRDSEGRIVGVVLVFRDVTREKRTEGIDRLLASIVESSDDAIYAKTLDGTILSWNGGAERIYGYTAAEVIGKNVSILVPPDMPDEVPEMLRQIGEGERIAHYETVRVKKDGSRVHVSMSLSPLADEDGRITGASSLARDITDRKLAEEALKRTAEELDRSNKELEQFAYIASHDMQEPLRTITGYLQLLSSRYKGHIDEKADRYIAYAVEGAERMSTLIRDLLSYSRVNTRGEDLRPTNAEESLEYAMRNLRSAIDQSRASYNPRSAARRRSR